MALTIEGTSRTVRRTHTAPNFDFSIAFADPHTVRAPKALAEEARHHHSHGPASGTSQRQPQLCRPFHPQSPMSSGAISLVEEK